MRRLRAIELGVLLVILVAQAVLFSRPIHSATNFDEDVYLAAVDALRHGQALGSDVFAAQFPGFYDLLRGLSFVTGIGVASIRWGVLAVNVAGTVGGWLVGRRYGGTTGGLLVAAFLVVAPPLDLFGFQVIADAPALALAVLAAGVATLAGPGAAVAAGAVFGAAFSVKLSVLTAVPLIAWQLRSRLAAGVGGFAIAVGLVLVAHLRALGDLWASGVTYHEDARSTPDVIPHPHRQIVDQIPHSTPFFWLVVAAAVAGLVFAARRRPLRVWPLWTWVALTVLFLLVHKPLHYNHLIEFPFTLAVAAGATLGAALERIPRAATAAVALALVAGYVQQLHRVDLARTPQPANELAAARALARLTPPDGNTIDDRPIVSFLARRRVVGRYVDLARLRWQTGSLTDATLIADLDRADAVVVSRALKDRPKVLRAVERGFTMRYRRDGVRIYTRR